MWLSIRVTHCPPDECLHSVHACSQAALCLCLERETNTSDTACQSHDLILLPFLFISDSLESLAHRCFFDSPN